MSANSVMSTQDTVFEETNKSTVFTMLEQVEQLEKINETYYFKFKNEDESVKYATGSNPLYMSIKRAFTSYAVL